MKLLREYIRTLLTEDAKGVEDLPRGVYIKIWSAGGDDVSFKFTNYRGSLSKKTKISGLVGIVKTDPKYGPCDGAYKMTWSKADKGWGPLLYDVAIEYATLNGNGLMADRMAVSPDAERIWQYYLDLRSDVTAHQLDSLEGELTPDNKGDDCSQDIVHQKIKHGDDWVKHPLSKRYTKPPRTIELLRKAGKLIEKA